MKILLAPDLHCYYNNYGKVLPNGKHSRFEDWESTAAWLLQHAVDNDIDVAVFPGDFFKNSRPDPEQVLSVAELLNTFATYGIEVIGCPGNHDLLGAGKTGPVDLVKSLCDDMYVGITNVPDVFRCCHDTVNIAVLPNIKPAGLIDAVADPAEMAMLISQKLVDIARSLIVQCHEIGPGCKNVLIGHWTISGSVASSGQLLYGSTEPVIPLNELLAMEWDAVLFGHIHKAQVLNEKPFVGYAGALERVDFGEEDDPRGCYIIDLDSGSYEWIDLPARKFCTISADIKSSDDIAALYEDLSLSLAHNKATNKIVRVKYKVAEELAPMVDHSEIMRLLQTAAPAYIAGIFPEIEMTDRSRETSVTEDTGPIDALRKWLDAKDIHGEIIRGQIIGLAMDLITEVLSE